MAGRRIAPLIVLVVVGVALLLARLYHIQIVEREVWTSEAAGLVRAGAIRPYTRGAIFDARGRALREDRASYQLEFVYREFRRAHPLGLVAHARAALLGRNIALREAFENLEPWCDELLRLAPRQLDEFALGGALNSGTLQVAATLTPALEERRARRADARYYVHVLLALAHSDDASLAPKERSQLAKLAADNPDASWLELAGALWKRDVSALQADLAARLARSRADLQALSAALAREAAKEDAAAPSETGALEAFLATLDAQRERVADESASALFREAAGFSAHRIEPHILVGALDLDWIAARLAWDRERMLLWLERARAEYRRVLLDAAPERATAQLELGVRREDPAELVAACWAAQFVHPAERADGVAWREWRKLSVLDELSELLEGFDGRELPHERVPALPFETLERGAQAAPLEWLGLAQLELGASAGAEELEAAAQAWSAAFDGRMDREWVRQRCADVFARWEQELQAALAQRLAVSAAGERWRLRNERLEKALERARHVLKDYGSRPRTLLARPSYELAHMVARHRDRFAGFVVQDTRERVARLGRDGRPVAEALVGAVGAPSYQEELLAGELRAEFFSLARKGVRAAGDVDELAWLAQTLKRPDELRGRGGVEAYFDAELSGRNGYREVRGLQDLVERSFELDVPPIDGADLSLTLDLDLQEEAAAVLAAPEGPPDPHQCDYAWLSRPTGAIVLMRVDGSVLAAASHPVVARDDRGPAGIADAPFERTLRKPGFQPPGSSFKPFVALWALDHIARTDPQRVLECAMLPDGRGAGYVDVRCNVHVGHGAVDLRDALKRSCNSYFAMLGERFSHADWSAMAAEFGFGQPTGVRALGPRAGLYEDSFPQLFQRELSGRGPRLAGNGLSVVEATPMQLARATAALASGALPDVRLVQRVGAQEFAPASRPIAISHTSLEFVRGAMVACSNEAGGSARDALNASELGYVLAAKTGSGDIGVERVATADGQSRVRKHTWLVSYFPAHEPRYVLVVFCHDTLQTASHSSIWVARQFLQRPLVREFLAQDGGL
jgi:cell division protein FtsI/penicillin-binding protein 2